MSLREWLNKRPWISGGVTGIVVIAAGWLAYRSLADTGEVPMPTKAYWSADDGASTFVDSIEPMSPMQKDGRSAVRAHVFSKDNGKTTFVGFLEKQSDAYVKKMSSKATLPKAATDQEAATARMVKKPGVGEWTPLMSSRGGEITTPRDPAGAGGPLSEVYPDGPG